MRSTTLFNAVFIRPEQVVRFLLCIGQILDCVYNGIELTQSHRAEKVISDSYDKCLPGFTCGPIQKHDVCAQTTDLIDPGYSLMVVNSKA